MVSKVRQPSQVPAWQPQGKQQDAGSSRSLVMVSEYHEGMLTSYALQASADQEPLQVFKADLEDATGDIYVQYPAP